MSQYMLSNKTYLGISGGSLQPIPRYFLGAVPLRKLLPLEFAYKSRLKLSPNNLSRKVLAQLHLEDCDPHGTPALTSAHRHSNNEARSDRAASEDRDYPPSCA